MPLRAASCPSTALTVVSASLAVSNILSQHESIDIIQLGGMLRHSSLSVVGEYAADILAQCSFSKLYLGVDGIDFDYGITTTEMREASLNQKMIAAAQKTIVLADSSKFGRRGFAKIADIDAVDIIITDAGVSPKVVKKGGGPGHRTRHRPITKRCPVGKSHTGHNQYRRIPERLCHNPIAKIITALRVWEIIQIVYKISINIIKY